MIVDEILETLADTEVNAEGMQVTMTAHAVLLALHTKALACHCECLGMNAENCVAACADAAPPYNDNHYAQVMQKWGLINEKGEVLI